MKIQEINTQDFLKRLETVYGEDAKRQQERYLSLAEKCVYTGTIDSYFDYSLGELDYRSLRFETEILDIPQFQPVAVVNYNERQIPYTRIIEHKHFEFGKQSKTVISKEYSSEWNDDSEPYYPVNNEINTKLYLRYKELADSENNVIFGGRLAEYKYYDMHHIVEQVMNRPEFKDFI